MTIPKQRDASPKSLTVTTEGESVVPLPGCSARRPCLVVQMSFSTESPVLLACRCKSSELPVLVDWIADPVDSRVVTNSIMGDIDQNHLIVLVSRILFQFQEHSEKELISWTMRSNLNFKTIYCSWHSFSNLMKTGRVFGQSPHWSSKSWELWDHPTFFLLVLRQPTSCYAGTSIG